jgi:hypothetical protein
MTCVYCKTEFTPTVTWQKYCTHKCYRKRNSAAHYQRHKQKRDAQSKAWAKKHPRRRKVIYLRYQRNHAKEIYARNKWRQAEWYARRQSREVLLNITPPVCTATGRHRGRIECHHNDGNVFNQAPANLRWLCKKHHEALHHEQQGPNAVILASLHQPDQTTDRS